MYPRLGTSALEQALTWTTTALQDCEILFDIKI